MKQRLLVAAVFASVCLVGPASAQQPPASTNIPEVTVDSLARVAVPSSLDRPSEAVRRNDVGRAAPLPASTQSLGTAKAQMAVGGAAIVVGALIGGDGGSVLMFGGAVVGLYGLWNYLK